MNKDADKLSPANPEPKGQEEQKWIMWGMDEYVIKWDVCLVTSLLSHFL